MLSGWEIQRMGLSKRSYSTPKGTDKIIKTSRDIDMMQLPRNSQLKTKWAFTLNPSNSF